MVELHLSFRLSQLCVASATLRVQAGVAAGTFVFLVRLLHLLR
jgi:hypothetical protein